MDGRNQYDIRNATFEAFLDFLFGQDVVPIPEYGSGDPEPWYWNADVLFDPTRVASFYIALFTAPQDALKTYSSDQLEQGFWAIQSSNIECAVTEIIWDRRLPFEIRESCVRSMFDLYEKLFSDVALDTAAEMWWDSLAYDWHCGNRARSNGGEDHLMQDAMFETLNRILQLPSRECQAAALHGLGHLHHPHTSAVIAAYLAHRPNVDSDLKEYALAAARFEVL